MNELSYVKAVARRSCLLETLSLPIQKVTSRIVLKLEKRFGTVQQEMLRPAVSRVNYYFQNLYARAYSALVLGSVEMVAVPGQRGTATGWTGLRPGTVAPGTYHDVVPAIDGFPIIPQEIASCVAIAAVDDATVATGGAIIWVGHPNSP